MPWIPQGRAVKVSQKWIQKLVTERPVLLASLISTQLDLPYPDTITGFSPLAEDGYAEYQDQASIDCFDIMLLNDSFFVAMPETT